MRFTPGVSGHPGVMSGARADTHVSMRHHTSTSALLICLTVLTGCAPSPTPAARPAQGATPGPAAAAADATPAAATSVPPELGIDRSAHSTTDADSPWVVVNKQHPLDPMEFTPSDLVVVHGYYVRAVAADDLSALLDAAERDGVTLTLRSTYRSYAKQTSVHVSLVTRMGEEEADKVSARAGYSEHQTGLAVDIGGSTEPACDFETCFGDTVEGRWVADHATEFGFIVRYTAADEAVTGYAPEAWHLRYVGRPLAAAMAASGIATLEEVFGVTSGPDYS